jgi:hypothetical protein
VLIHDDVQFSHIQNALSAAGIERDQGLTSAPELIDINHGNGFQIMLAPWIKQPTAQILSPLASQSVACQQFRRCSVSYWLT